jgi:hypothetical protein
MPPLGARGGLRVVLFLAAITCAIALLAWSESARGFTRAVADDAWFDGGGQVWLQRTQAAQARLAVIEVDWSSLELSPPAGVDPTDPGGPEYSFTELDRRVRELADAGVSAAFVVGNAPGWAEVPGGPASLEADGAWKPNAQAYGQLAAALARRYSGSHPDPLDPGHALPRVRYFQAWAEANLSVHLAPQWTKSRGSLNPTGAIMYRDLLNAFYAGVKSVHSNNFVIATGLGPYGDAPGICRNGVVGSGCRMRPVLFTRELLCLSGQSLRTLPCPHPAHFDALAVDPYEVGTPTTHAFNADDVSVPDLRRLTRVLKRGVATNRALPHRHKQLWVTEFGYDSNPPNPKAVSLATQARWLDEAFYMFWSQGVSTATWYLVRDPTPGFNPNDFYTGLYFYGGSPKPAYEAYRFPFVVWPSGRSSTTWGISPRTGRLAVQRETNRHWKTLFSLHAVAGKVFNKRISPHLTGHFRGLIGGEASLTWKR